MNRALLSLLGQQAASQVVPQDEYQGQIDVVGQGNQPIELPNYDDYTLNNAPAVMGRDQDIKQTEEASGRRGMFGMKGTLRDVLGVLGDAFLVQSGNAPMYAPTRRKEHISDAMAGFTVDPVSAIERVSYYDPEMGQKLYEDYETSLLKKAQQDSLAAGRQSQIIDRNLENLQKGRLAVQGVLAQRGAIGPDGNITPAAMNVINLIARQHQVPVEELMGANMTGEEAALYGTAGMNVNQQRNLPIAQQRADASTMSAKASMIRANRPPQGRAPRAETDSERAIRIGDKPEGQRTKGEKEWYKNWQGDKPSLFEALTGRPAGGSRFRPSRSN